MSDILISQLEDHIEKITKIVFEIYVYIANIDLSSIRNKHLFNLRILLDTLRHIHCTILHNERSHGIAQNRKYVLNEHHHSALENIRQHIADLQDDKQEFNYTYIEDKIDNLRQTTQRFINLVLQVNLQQNYYVRIQFYKFHQKALAAHCMFYHTYLPFIKSWPRTHRSELEYAELHQRTSDLIWSFQDKRHHLHTTKEPIPHPDFMRY